MSLCCRDHSQRFCHHKKQSHVVLLLFPRECIPQKVWKAQNKNQELVFHLLSFSLSLFFISFSHFPTSFRITKFSTKDSKHLLTRQTTVKAEDISTHYFKHMSSLYGCRSFQFVFEEPDSSHGMHGYQDRLSTKQDQNVLKECQKDKSSCLPQGSLQLKQIQNILNLLPIATLLGLCPDISCCCSSLKHFFPSPIDAYLSQFSKQAFFTN